MEKVMFGTEEWFNAFIARLNKDAEYERIAKNYEGSILFRCLADPSVHPILGKDLLFYFDPYHGKVREWRVVNDGEEQKAEYEVYGKYKDWKKLATGELDMRKAVLMTRQVKIKGKMSALIRHMKAAERTLAVLSEMKEEFYFPEDQKS
ncbi:MAG: SCP2 sterol-binding domain-containing protein [Thermodesulfobacteriota bacterium]